ncbi:hypothetical protein BJX99DRAFT_235759 [Aspergillus californicus]
MPPRPTQSTRAAPASATAPESARKRRASARIAEASTPESTALKKQKYDSNAPETAVKATAKKSKYFKKNELKKLKTPKKRKKPRNEYISDAEEDTDTSDSNGHLSDEDSDFWRAEEEKTTAISGAIQSFGQKRVAIHEVPTKSKGKDLWREGVKTGLGPGKEVFIEKPKARDPGDVPYNDDTLHPNTMLFLTDLAKNNDRQWLKANDADYRTSKKDWDSFVEALTEKIIDKDGTIPELPAKDLVFRIHRDIRFSKNPTPYKTHFSAAWSRTGRKGPYAAYYVHLEPGACFVGAGLWNPEVGPLARIREDIDGNSQDLKAVLNADGMRREFFGGIPDDEDEAVEAFVSQNSEGALRTKPRGYVIDNENIQLLRLRGFTIRKELADADLLSADAQDKIATLIGIMEPFVTYLNSVVMPDPAGQGAASDSSEDD